MSAARRKKDYRQRAINLIESKVDGVNILGHEEIEDGEIITIRFNTQEGDLAVHGNNRGIVSLYKPKWKKNRSIDDRIKKALEFYEKMAKNAKGV